VKDIEILRRCWSGPLDPIIPKDQKGFNSRAIIDATRPYEWLSSFPPVSRSSKELRERVLGKWEINCRERLFRAAALFIAKKSSVTPAEAGV
jgi:hypothetical protein